MSFLIMLLVLLAVIFVPVMIGARVVGARNTGFGAALLSVLALALITVARPTTLNQFNGMRPNLRAQTSE